jgi:hypothetical protein
VERKEIQVLSTAVVVHVQRWLCGVSVHEMIFPQNRGSQGLAIEQIRCKERRVSWKTLTSGHRSLRVLGAVDLVLDSGVRNRRASSVTSVVCL